MPWCGAEAPSHILLWWLEDHKADELLEPAGLQVSAGLCKGRLVLPHHFQELLLGLPEGLLKLQEDLVVGAEAQAANGLCFPLGQGGLEKVLMVFFEETYREKIRQLLPLQSGCSLSLGWQWGSAG